MSKRHPIHRWIIFGAAFLIFLWAMLYLPHLRNDPKWFMDETSALISAKSLVSGTPSYVAMWNTFYHPVAPYQPVYLFLTGIFAQGDIWGARFFNALLGLAIALLLFLAGRKIMGIRGAFFAAVLFLGYDQVVLHFRSVFPHNSVALGWIFAFLALLQKKYWRAGIGLAIGAMCHPMFIYGIIAALVARWKHPRSWFPIVAPSAIYLLISLTLIYWKFGGWLLDDLQSLFLCYHENSQRHTWAFWKNFYQFFSRDWFHLGFLICWAWCVWKRKYALAGFSAVVIALLIQNRNNLTTFYYQAIAVFPILCVVWGSFLAKVEKVWRTFLNEKSRTILDYSKKISSHLSFPLLAGIQRNKGRVYLQTYFWDLTLFIFGILFCILPTGILSLKANLDQRSLHGMGLAAQDAESAAQWVNDNTTPEDFVVAETNIGWLLHAKTARFMQAIAYEGKPFLIFRKSMPPERFFFDCSIEKAKYIVVCGIDVDWEPAQGEWKKFFEGSRGKFLSVAQKTPTYSIFLNSQWIDGKLENFMQKMRENQEQLHHFQQHIKR
ncbi:MAG: ArnT family glycosyltransferase [Verrucomicrobiota bacterium]